MSIVQFRDRDRELDALREILNSDSFRFLVLYGRRRIGKTALVMHATEKSRRIYYLSTGRDDIEGFMREAAITVPSVSNLKPDWETVLDFLKDKVDVIIIDEFQSIFSREPTLMGAFQRVIDHSLSKSKIKLIVCGSSISILRDIVMNYSSPLYGRRTHSMTLGPIGFFELSLFFPESGLEELVEMYGFSGGIPFYMNRISSSFWNWLDSELKNPASFLLDEMQFLLRYEFNETSTYEAILGSVAAGDTKVGEIKNRIGLVRTDVFPYLRNLENVGFVKRITPQSSSRKSREGRYYLSDYFLNFWYRYIYSNRSSIASGIFGIDVIKKDYRTYLGKVFEEVVRQYLINHKGNGFHFTRIGPWWHREKEIDLIGVDDASDDVLFVECKYSKGVNGDQVANVLREKSMEYLHGRSTGKVSYAVFALDFTKRTEAEDLTFFDGNDLENALRR